MRLAVFLLKLLIILLIAVLALELLFEKTYQSPNQIKYGVSFSPSYAQYLKLDWQKTYTQILDELKVKNLRIPSYWNSDLADTDFMLDEASKRQVRTILVLGARQPRWPECHLPAWAKKLSVVERQQATLQFVQKVVERYQSHEAIWAWQVENEPFAFWFGQNCDTPDKKFLQEEVNLVKQLDPRRPIIITDSGEWGLWISAMQSADSLGISLYRKAHFPNLGYITYPFPAFMYQLKSNMVRKLFAHKNLKTIITELQAEPWVQKGVPDTALKEQIRLFSLQDFKDIIEYTQKTGFDEHYMWGVEWWYWMAQKGYPEYLDYAKTLF